MLSGYLRTHTLNFFFTVVFVRRERGYADDLQKYAATCEHSKPDGSAFSVWCVRASSSVCVCVSVSFWGRSAASQWMRAGLFGESGGAASRPQWEENGLESGAGSRL